MKFFRALFLSLALLIAPASAADYVAGPAGAGNIPALKSSGTACTGCIGQTLQSVVAVGGAVNLVTSGLTYTVTSVNLTAGNWLVWGSATFNPAGTTTISGLVAGISTVSATFMNPQAAFPFAQIQGTLTTGAGQGLPLTPVLISVSAATPVYLVASAGFGTSTMGAYGSITAMRLY